MGRNPIKENQNPYFRARKQAAEWDARLESRERASELIGIAAYTLADYELGNVKRVPADKVLIMADLYNAPWLLSNYCKNECPICGFLPLATEEKNICSVTVRLLKALREDELENMKNQLLEISQDGKIRDDEVGAVRNISEYLDGMERLSVQRSIMNNAALGEEAKMQYIGDPNAFLLAYATDSPAVDEPSAGYIFTWDMLGNGNVLPIRQFEGEQGTHSEFIEGLMATDMKKTGDDLAMFFKDAV